MAYKATGHIGFGPLDDTGTVQKFPLGTVVEAWDPLYGVGKFVYLKGVASTAAGDLVVYDVKNGTTTRTVAASRGVCAIAMSANVANQFGWYCIQGTVPVNCAAAAAAATPLFSTATPGAVDDAVVAGSAIDGLFLVTAAGGAGLFDAVAAYPSMAGLA